MTTAVLHGLRMAGDLLVYSAFAAFFEASLGGQPGPLLWLLPALCYGLSACLMRHPVLRTGCAALALPGLLLAPGWVDRAAWLPAILYPLYLAWKGEYFLSADRQTDLFLLFCKAYPVFAILLSLAWNARAMLTVSLPLAVWAVLMQVFLMRVLRQTDAAARSPGYLLANAGLLLGLGGLGFAVSRPAVLGSLGTVLGAVYFGLVVPVLSVPLALAAWLVEHLVQPALWAVLGWLASKAGRQNSTALEGTASSLHSSYFTPAAQPLLDGEQMLKILGVILLVTGGILLFRRLVQKNKVPLHEAGPVQTRQISRKGRRRWPSFFLSPNARVRRAYERYLDRQARHGVTRGPAETSLDLLGRTPFLDPEAERQLRRLYLKARYGECATSEDAVMAESLERTMEPSEEE